MVSPKQFYSWSYVITLYTVLGTVSRLSDRHPQTMCVMFALAINTCCQHVPRHQLSLTKKTAFHRLLVCVWKRENERTFSKSPEKMNHSHIRTTIVLLFGSTMYNNDVTASLREETTPPSNPCQATSSHCRWFSYQHLLTRVCIDLRP